jgi:hypothetical protein
MKSRKLFSAVLLVVAFWGLGSMANAGYIEPFNSDNASWRYGYGLNFTLTSPASWVNPGGNPGGYISGDVANLYAIWTYTTPYGNITGLSLTIDTKVTGTPSGNAQFYVGRKGTYYIDPIGWSIANDTSWTTHTVALDPSYFSPWSGQGTPTLAYVLAAPDDIGIFFGGSVAGGSGTLAVDNFGTVPEPSLILLLGIGFGAVSLVGWRFRA